MFVYHVDSVVAVATERAATRSLLKDSVYVIKLSHEVLIITLEILIRLSENCKISHQIAYNIWIKLKISLTLLNTGAEIDAVVQNRVLRISTRGRSFCFSTIRLFKLQDRNRIHRLYWWRRWWLLVSGSHPLPVDSDCL